MISVKRLEEMQQHISEGGKLNLDQELLTELRTMQNALSYAYMVINRGFEFGSFDFSVLRNRAENIYTKDTSANE